MASCTYCGVSIASGRRCATHTPTRSKRTGSTRQWRKDREAVLLRDAGICHLCGEPGADSADHLVPRSRGGTDALTNLKAAHQSCNFARGDMDLEEWFKRYPIDRMRRQRQVAAARPEPFQVPRIF